MVIEPDSGMRSLLAEILAVHGVDAVVCANDNDAMKAMRQPRGRRPNVVLCHAPTAGTKNALVGRIRASDELKGIPVLCISHSNGLSERAHAFEQGASEYIVRPVSPGELIERLRHWARRVHVPF